MQGYDRMTEMKTSFLSCFKTKLNKDGQNLSREVCNMCIMDLAKFLYLKCTKLFETELIDFDLCIYVRRCHFNKPIAFS